nr:Uncharacterised protein [Raoultella sp. NCTC 9187]
MLLTTSSGKRPLIGSTILAPVLLGGVLRVNLQSRKTRHSSHGLDSVTDSLIEYLTDIGSRVGTDKQNTLSQFSQTYSRCAGNRSFAYTSLTG